MAEDQDMTDQLDATGQVLAIFKQMAPMWDHSLQLSENPGLQKRQRKDAGVKAAKHQQPSPDLAKAMTLMARLVIRQDQEIQASRREDTFLLFFDNKEKTAALPLLVQAASAWHQQMQQNPDQKPQMPLRQHLLQTLMRELLTRLTKLGEADANSDLRKVALQNQVLLPNLTCPYLEWDPVKKALKISSKQPLSLQRVVANVQEFLEMCTQTDLILRFHSLPSQATVTPWKLQLSIRADREYELMKTFCQSSIWTLMGVTVKSHNHHQSGLATQLAATLGLNQTKGKNKGHGKGKSTTSPKTET